MCWDARLPHRQNDDFCIQKWKKGEMYRNNLLSIGEVNKSSNSMDFGLRFFIEIQSSIFVLTKKKVSHNVKATLN